MSIVSDRPQTTRTQVRGVRTTDDDADRVPRHAGHAQAAHAARRARERAGRSTTLGEVDVDLLPDRRERADRAAATGSSPSWSAQVRDAGRARRQQDRPGRAASRSLEHLAVASAELGDLAAFVPLSARTGEGVDALVGELEARLPEGPHYYPDGVVSDQPESFLAAELLREKLLAHDARRAAALDRGDHRGGRGAGDRRTARCSRCALVIRVERDSQKGIVIGKGGAVLRQAGTEARARARSAARGARAPRDPRAGRSRLAAPGVVARPPRPLTGSRDALVIARAATRAVGITELRSGESAAVESPRLALPTILSPRETARCWTARNGSGAGL